MPIKHKLMLLIPYDIVTMHGDMDDGLIMKPFTSIERLTKHVMKNKWDDDTGDTFSSRFNTLKEVQKYMSFFGSDAFRVEDNCEKLYSDYVLPEMVDEQLFFNYLPSEKQTEEEVNKLVHKCKTDFKYCSEIWNDLDNIHREQLQGITGY
tara:strand:- start:35 stop:484 length:450 start_codon:yes stop_codon:yes gene_type:complete